jgi:hypothetical protein
LRLRLGSGLHDESWVQTLIPAHPAIRPIGEINQAWAI